jgi:N-methylhydantoinase A
MARKRLAVDVGGTFIDFVVFDEAAGTVRIEKIPSLGLLDQRFIEGVDRLGLDVGEVYMIIHGSTLVINTILQESGARIGLITTQGFRDVYELGRGNRAEIYNLFYRPPAPLVPRYLRHEVRERINARGAVLEPLDESQAREVVRRLRDQAVEGIAIVFLHAYVNPAHEQRMAQIVEESSPALSCRSRRILCVSGVSLNAPRRRFSTPLPNRAWVRIWPRSTASCAGAITRAR